MTAEEARLAEAESGDDPPEATPALLAPVTAAVGGILVLAAFPSIPLLVSGAGGSSTGRQVAVAAGWLGSPLWLLPAAAVLLVVLGWQRARSVGWTDPTRMAALLAAAAGLGVVGLIMGVKRLQRSAVSLYGTGIDPASAIGPGYWILLAGLLIAFLGGVRELVASRGSTMRSVPVVAGATAGVVLGTIIAATVLGVRQDIAHRGVVLLAANTTGDGAFGPDFDLEHKPESPDPALHGEVTGNTEQLYSGRFGQPSCDRDAMLAFVARASPARSAMWLTAATADQGYRQPGTELSAVRLRTDIRVTAHRFDRDRITAYHTVLQAGTAVLVDRHGIPRVRCTGAIPLTPPQNTSGRPNYLRPPWPGFDAATLVTVTRAPSVVQQFGLTDDGHQFRRPQGTNGKADIDQVPARAVLEGTYTFKGKLKSCDLTDCTKQETVSLSVDVSGCPDQCRIASPDWTGTLPMTEASDTWTATGSVVKPFYCAKSPLPTMFTVSVRITGGGLVGGTWTAKQVEGVYSTSSPATVACASGTLTWDIVGFRG